MKKDERALFIVQELKKHGHTAFYAGGCVRDYLLKHPLQDIDIATDATPEELQKIFPHTVPVGIAFGILLVIIDNRQYEVATFRKEEVHKNGRYPEKVIFTSAKEDAVRRDFTINGMFYDPLNDVVHDFVEGQKDLENKIIRAIGNPQERFFEDRLRMVRAARFAARFDFIIENETFNAIKNRSAELFPAVSIERVWQEIAKMAQHKNFKKALLLLFEMGLLQVIFPALQTLSPADLKKRLAHIDKFPRSLPVILQIQELFPGISLDERLALCRYFKLSNYEQNVINYVFNIKDGDSHYWAQVYAHDLFELFWQWQKARLPAKEREIFIELHEKKQKLLSSHIRRLCEKKPLVTAEHLQAIGIAPGKKMGELLREAERIAINRNLDNASDVIDFLNKELT